MKFFLDTANVDHIKQIYELGLLDGVTTNPSLVAKTGKTFTAVVKEICSIVKGPVSLEVVSTEAPKMLEEAYRLMEFGSQVVIKIPMILEGLKAVKILSEKGIKTNVTLCFSPLQALLAAKAGATYISPFVGRLDDICHDGMELVKQIKDIYTNYDYKTEIIVASIRHPLHILDAALMGADISTIPFDVFGKIALHPLTDRGLEQFLKDWKSVPAEKI